MLKQAKGLAAATALGLLAVLFYCASFNYTRQYEAGIRFNVITGEVTLGSAGAHLTVPWVLVSNLDMRPQRVCVSTKAKVLRCRLVQWEAQGVLELVQREGFRYYWWDNRISFNQGHDEEYRGERDLIRGYAFDSKAHPFLKVLQETD